MVKVTTITHMRTAVMSAPPLTHHDIIRCAAPLTHFGFKVNLASCDRAARYIEFDPQDGHLASVKVFYALEVDNDNKQLISRILVHESGLVSTLNAISSDVEGVLKTFNSIPLSRQLYIEDHHVAAFSYELAPDFQHDTKTAVLRLRYVCAHVDCVELRIDGSTGGGMPADVRLLTKGLASNYLPDTLADGGDLPLDHRAARRLRTLALANTIVSVKPEIPDDILAVLGPQWRPLRSQGDHWKGVLRLLTNRDKRTLRIENFAQEAFLHLHATLSSAPEHYQSRHKKARWQVYARRLQPVMMFIGILALMPISWLLVSSGTMTIHPLALGLTPLLMVGVIILTAREIPVMELPPRPAPLSPHAWNSAHGDIEPQ